MTYRYFVSYSHAYGNQFGFGHTETTTNFKITGIDRIREIAEDIENHFGYKQGSVMIMNFKPFEE